MGRCGGSGCGQLPGGGSQCCTSAILEAGRSCVDFSDTACVIPGTGTPSPTSSPTSKPTTSPTKSPTTSPTKSPTTSPTVNPTKSPSKNPTSSPTRIPTNSPTKNPVVREVILQHYEIDCHRWLVHLPSGLLLRLLDGRCDRRCSEPGVQPGRFRQQDWVLLGHLAGRQGRHYGENQQGEAAWLRRGCVRSLHRPNAQRRVRST